MSMKQFNLKCSLIPRYGPNSPTPCAEEISSPIHTPVLDEGARFIKKIPI